MGRDTLRQVDYLFRRIFSLYTSFGITPEVAHSVRVEGERIVAVMNQGDPHQEHTYTASLVITNGLPTSGLLQPNFPGAVQPHPFRLSYTYDAKTVPLPFPKEITRTIRVPKAGLPEDADLAIYGEDRVILRLVVKGMEVADRSSRLPPEMFKPDPALLGSKYEHHVITNGQRFRVSGKQLILLDAEHNRLPPPTYRGDPKSKRLVVILLFVTACILPVVVLAARRKRQQYR